VVTFLMLLGRLELFPLLLFLAAPSRRLADLVTRR
jgi:Trk-type K+ transport system membrane component